MKELRVGILTVSDRSAAGVRADETGPALVRVVTGLGWQVGKQAVCADEVEEITRLLKEWSDNDGLDLILTTGGTGFAARDVTPEATTRVIDRQAPGLAEAIRAESRSVTIHAILSRAVSGLRGNTIILNLPGNPKGALEGLAVVSPVLPHAVAVLKGDTEAEAGHRGDLRE